jgi:DUF1680 family protein
VAIETETRYPWEGEVSITVKPEAPLSFKLALRVPGWCRNYTARLNGAALDAAPVRGYLEISREWKAGDRVELRFDMPARINEAHPAVRENTGKIALSRGPLVYCLEEADNGPGLHLLSLGEAPDFQARFEKDLLGGITVIRSRGRALDGSWPGGELYREAEPPRFRERRLTWIPYYAWANRGPGEMRVWISR